MNRSFLTSQSAFKETNDCVVRAMALACEMDYSIAHAILKKRGREDRKGTYTRQVFNKKAETIKGCLLLRRDLKHEITLVSFLKKYPVGNFICIKAHHGFAVVNCECSDPGLGKCVRIKYFYQCKPNYREVARIAAMEKDYAEFKRIRDEVNGK